MARFASLLLLACILFDPTTQLSAQTSPGIVCTLSFTSTDQCLNGSRLRWVDTNRPPEYPPIMLAAGIPGRAVIEFTVRNDGSVDPGSLRGVETSHRLFYAAIQRVVPTWRFGVPRGAPPLPVRFVAYFGLLSCAGDPCLVSVTWGLAAMPPEVVIAAYYPRLVPRNARTTSPHQRPPIRSP